MKYQSARGQMNQTMHDVKKRILRRMENVDHRLLPLQVEIWVVGALLLAWVVGTLVWMVRFFMSQAKILATIGPLTDTKVVMAITQDDVISLTLYLLVLALVKARLRAIDLRIAAETRSVLASEAKGNG